MTRHWKSLFSVLMTVALLLGQGQLAAGAPSAGGASQTLRFSPTAEYCAESEEAAFLTLINDYRAANGLGQLVLTQTLGAAAEHHSLDMATNNYFSHTLFNGTTWSQNMTNHGYTYNTYRAEIIAGGYETAAQVIGGWKASPGHNAAMLGTNYHAIGIGRAAGSGAGFPWYWTAVFGGHVDAGAVRCSGNGTMPTAQPTATRTPTPAATDMPQPVATATSTPRATATTLATAVPTRTPSPLPTSAALPTATTPPPTATIPPPTSTLVPQPTATAQPQLMVYVSSMNGSVQGKRNSSVLAIRVNVKDSMGAAVPAAAVSMVLTMPNGSSRLLTASTDGRGQATWSVPADGGAGNYVATVSSVSAAGRVYDASRNKASNLTLKV